MTTVADGSASLLRLVEKACTSMLSKQLNPTETSLAVKNLNLPAKFHLLNSGKGDLPGEVVRLSPLSLRSLAISLGADHCCSIVIVLSKTLVMVSRLIPDSGSQQIWVESNNAFKSMVLSACLGATHRGFYASPDARVLSLSLQQDHQDLFCIKIFSGLIVHDSSEMEVASINGWSAKLSGTAEPTRIVIGLTVCHFFCQGRSSSSSPRRSSSRPTQQRILEP